MPTHRTTPTPATQAILAAIAQRHLAIDTLQSRGLDSLDVHGCSVESLQAALQAAYEAGRRGTRSPARAAGEERHGDITLTRRPQRGDSGWVEGRIGAYRFSAKVYAGHALVPSYEIGSSRISKLHLTRLADGATAYAWDRGLDIQAIDAAAQTAVDCLCRRLADLIHGPVANG